MDIDRSKIHSILVIKLRAIGDVLLSSAVLKSLRGAFPGARIDFLTEGPSRQVIEGNPDVDSPVIFEGGSGLGLILSVRRRNYDLVIDLFSNPRSALVTAASGARYRAGYRFSWRRYCYNIPVEGRGGQVHNVQFNLDALRALGISVGDTSVPFHTDRASEEHAERFFSTPDLSGRSCVALNPGGGWYTKRWPPGSFALLADLIAREFGASIVIIWGPGERESAQAIASLMSSRAHLIPESSLRELASILRRCRAVITNDTGPMHLAAAVGTSVLAIFGPTIPELQGPVGEGHAVIQNRRLVCLGCNLTACPIGNPCMEKLSPGEVFAAFRALVQKNQLFKHQRPLP